MRPLFPLLRNAFRRTALGVALVTALPLTVAAEVPIPRMAPGAATVMVAGVARLADTLEAMEAPATIERAIEAEIETDVWLAVAELYRMRDYAPVWTEARAATLRARLAEAAYDGLDPAEYAVPAFGDGITERAREDVALTEAALRYARHAHSGRLKPTSVSPIMTMEPPRLKELRFLVRLSRAQDVVKTLESAHPQHAQYQRLRAALRKALDTSVEQPPAVGSGQNLKRGVEDPRVAVLRSRLGATVRRGQNPNVFDDDLVDTVKQWQRGSGLTADGIVGPRTIAVLDAGLEADSAAPIISNLERWRWMPRWLGIHHVYVNIPSFTVEVRTEGEVVYDGRVVVGKSYHPTPIFTDEIEHIVVNPYWNVPYSIAKNEMLGAIRANPSGYMSRNNYEVVFNGRVVNPSSINWNTDTLRRVRIRERPGRGNALGSVKFLFPNQHAVYLHDTPSKHLFSRDSRAFSHGCVRVQNPFDFAEALLSREPNMSGAGLRRLVGGRQQWLNTERHIPVHLAYFTRAVDDNGNLQRYADVYGYDARTQRKLGL